MTPRLESILEIALPNTEAVNGVMSIVMQDALIGNIHHDPQEVVLNGGRMQLVTMVAIVTMGTNVMVVSLQTRTILQVVLYLQVHHIPNDNAEDTDIIGV